VADLGLESAEASIARWCRSSRLAAIKLAWLVMDLATSTFGLQRLARSMPMSKKLTAHQAQASISTPHCLGSEAHSGWSPMATRP